MRGNGRDAGFLPADFRSEAAITLTYMVFDHRPRTLVELPAVSGVSVSRVAPVRSE